MNIWFVLFILNILRRDVLILDGYDPMMETPSFIESYHVKCELTY